MIDRPFGPEQFSAGWRQPEIDDERWRADLSALAPTPPSRSRRCNLISCDHEMVFDPQDGLLEYTLACSRCGHRARNMDEAMRWDRLVFVLAFGVIGLLAAGLTLLAWREW